MDKRMKLNPEIKDVDTIVWTTDFKDLSSAQLLSVEQFMYDLAREPDSAPADEHMRKIIKDYYEDSSEIASGLHEFLVKGEHARLIFHSLKLIKSADFRNTALRILHQLKLVTEPFEEIAIKDILLNFSEEVRSRLLVLTDAKDNLNVTMRILSGDPSEREQNVIMNTLLDSTRIVLCNSCGSSAILAGKSIKSALTTAIRNKEFTKAYYIALFPQAYDELTVNDLLKLAMSLDATLDLADESNPQRMASKCALFNLFQTLLIEYICNLGEETTSNFE